jgi:hypothetical protein
MVHFRAFPDGSPPPAWTLQLIDVFRRHEDEIGSARAGERLSSEEVLAVLANDLASIGFVIEKLQHGEKGAPAADAAPPDGNRVHFDVYHPQWLCCLAIEDGHDWANIGAADDLVEPLLVSNVDTLCVAVPFAEAQQPGGQAPRAGAYERTCSLAESVYGHIRVSLPQRLFVIGY